MEPQIIFENDDYIVIDKPAGLISHSDGRTHEPSVAEWILARWPQLAGVGAPWTSPQGEVVLRPGMVQRLDRTTSGIMLVAKTAEMYDHLKKEFKARRVEKVYRAFVYGHVPESGTIVAEVVRAGEKGKGRWEARACGEDDSQAAITEWQRIARGEAEGEKYSYIEVMPKTGRTHQIRVHFASIDFPLVADFLYAPTRSPILGFTRPALHAYSIAFTDLDEKRVEFTSLLPADFLADEGKMRDAKR